MKQNNSKPYEKKGQINKFEFQMNYLDNNKIECSVPESNDNLYKGLQEKKDMTETQIYKTQNGTPLKLGETSQVENILNREISEKILETCSEIPKKVKNKLELTKLSTTPELNNYLKLLEIHNTEKYAPELVLKLKKEKLDESQFDSFQDAFVKTLQVDCSLKKEIVSEISKLVTTKIEISDTKKVSITESVKTPSISANNMIMNFSIMNNFDNTEGVADNTKTEEKSTENNLITNYISNELLNNSVSNMKNNSIIEMDSIVTIEDKKIINNSTNSISITTAPTLSIPVKKREKPRIIENVALKEPMILKTKLIDKHVANIGKHKLDHDKIIADESKNISKTKLIKMETVICNTKTKLHNRSNNIDHITKKIKSLKSDNSSLKVSKDTENQELISTLPQIVSEISCADKYIQQSSQNLVDVDLDIISMPFVLSEDVLTPESIQQMPVVISSVLPAKIPITTLSSTLITSSKEISGTNYLIKSVKDVNEIGAKKKSGVPTILKNKNKLKPTITSIKTIVPPLTCKKNFKLNAQTLKTSLANKKTPGKYVIVQTSGHQQAYSTHPKVSIPTNKGSGNAQIVQHGSKVVILTSPQCGQSGQKILPFNSISKALSNGKVQRIITSKQGQEMYTSVSSENFVNSKNILASNNVLNSSITSRINNQKILSQQITSKSVLTQLPGTITKSVFGTLPQGIFIKEGVFTPINPSTLSGKTIISSKTFVTKGFAHQGINTLKNTLPQPLVSKTIINSQGIVSKGTVLTPITGSQVKALAAKNIKGNKLQYQLDPYKVQSGDTQNSLSVSSSSFIKNSTNFKTSNNVMILQKTDLKTVKPKKKFIKQTVPKKTSETAILSPSSTITLQKSKGSTNFEENNVSSKILNRSVNQQHKVFTDKTEKIMKINSVNNETLPIKPRIFEQRKNKTQISKSNKSINRSLHKKNSNLTKSVALSSLNSGTSISMTIPSSQIINYENIPKKEEIYESTSSKKETEKSSFQMQETLESTISVQSQIMALPTENSDGTQAYVLVTIDEHGHIGPLDNSTLMSLDGTSNLDGNKTLYIDSSSLSESGNISNIVLQIDNNSLSNTYNTNILNSVPTSVIETLPLSQNMQTTNQDILAVALANTDFQHEIGVAESSSSTSITSLTQTSLINQTILQSTIIPPTEPISSPSVLETSLTLNQPIMTPLEIPSSVSIQPNITPVTTVTTVPTSIELPISLTNQSISYTTAVESLIPIPEKSKETITLKDIVDVTISANTQLIKSDKDISTPSMEMIDDNFNTNNGFDSTNTSLITENNLDNYITKTSEELIQDLTGNDSLQENNESLQNISNDKITSSQQVILEAPKIIYSHIQDDSVLSEQNIKTTLKQFQKKNKLDLLNDLHKIEEKINTHEHVNTNINVLSESIVKVSENTVIIEQSNIFQEDNQMMNDKLHKKEKYQKKLSKITNDKPKITELSTKNVSGHSINSSVQNELNEVILKEYKIKFNDDENEINEKISSQSYKEFINIANDPSQFERSDSSHQSMQSFSSESLETNESILVQGLPVQSYEDLKQNENFQTQKSLNSNIINKSTQSLKKNLTLNDKTISINEDNSNFSSQNCNIAKIENYIGIMEAEADIGHEGSSPSISNDTCIDGVGPSSVSVNNLVLNEDETASSSYVPETPENQERDQDQESAISTSSYEIPPCEELNIASSSMIPDPSMQSEHLSIHNNDLPRITTSYNLNSDSNSTDVIAVSTSNYDQIIIEQNISTSYDVPISIGNTDKMNSQNYISDNLERRNESTSYYPHEEVSENYYDTICKQSSSQLETTSELESTPSYFESNPVDVISETSQNYFNQEEIVSNYSNHEIPSTYYDSRIENEKSFYSSHEENSTRLQHTEATQNFYQNRQHDQPVITTYTDRYSLDYVTESSSLDRHDLVDSSKIVKPMSR